MPSRIRPLLDVFMAHIEQPRYQVHTALLQTADYGAPQRRLRLVVQIGRSFPFPCLPAYARRSWGRSASLTHDPRRARDYVRPAFAGRGETPGGSRGIGLASSADPVGGDPPAPPRSDIRLQEPAAGLGRPPIILRLNLKSSPRTRRTYVVSLCSPADLTVAGLELGGDRWHPSRLRSM